MQELDVIELKNIEIIDKIPDYSYSGRVCADLFINGKKYNGFCDLSTFFVDSHLDQENPNRIFNNHKRDYLIPSQFHRSFYNFQPSPKKNNNISLPAYKKAKREILNPNFLVERQSRNHYFLHVKNISDCYLDSCSCGIAGCNGYFNGLKIKRKADRIVYSVANIKRDGYRSGILDTGKYKISISIENLIQIRKQLRPFFLATGSDFVK